MTTIAAYIYNGKAALASDRCGHLDGTNVERGDSKLVTRGGWTFGAAGGSAIHRRALLAIPDTGMPSADSIGEELYQWYRANGRLDPNGSMQGTTCLAMREGLVWLIDSVGGVVAVQDYAAIGGGADYAIGAMCSAWRWADCADVALVARAAVGAAITHDPYTDGAIDSAVSEEVA